MAAQYSENAPATDRVLVERSDHGPAVSALVFPSLVGATRHAVNQLCDLHMPILLVPIRLRVFTQLALNCDPSRYDFKRIDLALAKLCPRGACTFRRSLAGQPEGLNGRSCRSVELAHRSDRQHYILCPGGCLESCQSLKAIRSQLTRAVASFDVAAMTPIELDVRAAVKTVETFTTVRCGAVGARVNPAALVGVLRSRDTFAQA